MLNIHNISVSFSGEYLFEEVSYQLSPGDRAGLIGKNGAGKSTMLKLLAKEYEVDQGTIAIDKNISLGFLKQDIDFEKGRTVIEEAQQAFTEIKALEKQIEEVNNALASRTDYESESYHELMVSVGDLSDRYEIIGGYSYQGETERVLQGLGFVRGDFDKSTDTFSGGWRMRIELAKLLLQKNDVLLLDEPTNHLDIESILWFENFLIQYTGVVVIVSHDKMFLDNVTNRTIEISMGRIYDYPKPYTAFLALRDEIRTQQMAAQKNQEKQIQQTEKLIEKFRAKASKASMAQSLIKKLDKIERIEVDQQETAAMKLDFPVSVIPGKVVLELNNVSKAYGPKQVLRDVNLLVARSSKIAFVGQNGQGKTTLAKIIAEALEHQGEFKRGHNVQIGYFAQNQAEYLDGEKTVHDTMLDAANESNRIKVRDILGAFLFQGDDVDKYVKVLSGGERNRLALAKLLLEPFNVLVMDEPTNHLDIQSKEVLKQALQRFEGTLILVSHDRDFLQGLSSIVYEFRDQKIKEFLGDIDDYLSMRKLEDFRAVEKQTQQQQKTASAPNSYKIDKQKKSLKNKLSNIEQKIAQAEKEIAEIDTELAINYDQTIAEEGFFDRYQQKKNDLEALMQEWESLSEALEGI
ncbi:MAG: ABC-F family ATP-binding cassette domain-containing protein [Flavobacteriaceae bacterium]|nr:ABC-F family ATP-binding cassette domain-containing protein [Flavobacteriaceae bacterium]